MKKPWKLVAVAALVSIPLGIFAAGCGPECVDAFDCKTKNTDTTTYVCQSNKCVQDTSK